MTMHRLPILVVLALACSACGGGGGGDAADPSATAPSAIQDIQREWYDPPADTVLKAEGPVVTVAGATLRHGIWKEWYAPMEGHGLRWERRYDHGSWDRAADWTEWNPDGSIRAAGDDR